MASVTDSSKRHGAMDVDFIFGLCVCIARGDAPLSGALVFVKNNAVFPKTMQFFQHMFLIRSNIDTPQHVAKVSSIYNR
jgi:hypothetical protein